MSAARKRLKAARKTRSQRTQLFVALQNGDTNLRSVLEDPPRCLKKLRVFDLMRRAPHMGEKGADRVLRHAKVWPTKTLGDLTLKERQAIIDHLPPRAQRAA